MLLASLTSTWDSSGVVFSRFAFASSSERGSTEASKKSLFFCFRRAAEVEKFAFAFVRNVVVALGFTGYREHASSRGSSEEEEEVGRPGAFLEYKRVVEGEESSRSA